MIGYINGLLIDKDEKTFLVLAQNIGYKVFVTTELLSKTAIDQKVQLHIHTSVREDDISLYGFSHKEELKFYEQLIGVSGIGPKMAMDILGSPTHLTKQAILTGDAAMLTSIKGLGKKTAERMILELKNKVTVNTEMKDGGKKAAYNEEAVMALVSLGYEKFEVIKALAELPIEINETEEVVKAFLKQA